LAGLSISGCVWAFECQTTARDAVAAQLVAAPAIRAVRKAALASFPPIRSRMFDPTQQLG
jgi:hypothetical protein